MAPAGNHVHRGAKRHFKGQHKSKKQKKQKLEAPLQITGSNDEILVAEINALSLEQSPQTEADSESEELPEPFTEVEVDIVSHSSTGDGLGRLQGSSRIYLVPFTTTGDRVRVKVIRHASDPPHTVTDFLQVIKPGPDRNDSLVNCKYFAKCSGCQLQMLPYSVQLAHKRRIVEKAYKFFSRLPPAAVPEVGETIGSPLQYGYRTKLTPHFDGPTGGRRAARKGETPRFSEIPPIGFMLKGTRKTMDIEECPIGTDVVNVGMKRERKRVERELDQFKRGATILLRESTQRLRKAGDQDEIARLEADDDTVVEDRGDHIHAKSCVSDHKGTSTEYVDDFVFHNPANAFFQNNNSILPRFIGYIRDHILPSDTAGSPKITNLIDAYSGSGLFGINLSSLFTRTIGIDISGESIASATENLKLNKLDASARDIKFMAGDASKLFESVPSDWVRSETVVVIDPPRKGCDESFLKQVTAFQPARIVYVSCNVHTQARDVGWILRGGADPDEASEDLPGEYEMESLRGFDFFPQTGHVEGVAVLQRKASAPGPSNNGGSANGTT